MEMFVQNAASLKLLNILVLQDFILQLKLGLKKEKKVSLPGFATFTAKKKAAKTGRNPRTGAPVKIPARVAATIKAGSKLKAALN